MLNKKTMRIFNATVKIRVWDNYYEEKYDKSILRQRSPEYGLFNICVSVYKLIWNFYLMG